jgi:hypothetical protein
MSAARTVDLLISAWAAEPLLTAAVSDELLTIQIHHPGLGLVAQRVSQKSHFLSIRSMS